MKPIYLFLLLALTFSLTNCTPSNSGPLISEPSRNNSTYIVDYLFEHNGCSVYRFCDEGNYVYFTNCNGEAIHLKKDTSYIRRIQNKTTVTPKKD